MIFFITISCSRTVKHSDQNNDLETIEVIEIAVNSQINVDANHIRGYINNNNLRIRSNPDTNSEILGVLNEGDYVSVIGVSEQKILINNFENFWYNVITENELTGWIFGEYIDLMPLEKPIEFENITWRSAYGNLPPIKNITVNDLQSCSWRRYNTHLFFTKNGYYAKIDRWDHPVYGRYILQDNIISFIPPIEIIRFSEPYFISKLHYSNEMHYEGSPVLRNQDETVLFTANNSRPPEVGEIIRMYQHYCEKMWERAKVNINGYLFSLPDKSSTNIFANNFYGRKAMEAKIVKLAKTNIDNIIWYYVLFDFTSGDPIDGGGPFYEGWLPQIFFD
jgi:hypothetical protein